MSDPIRLYSRHAAWFHLLSAPAEYAEEAEFYAGLLAEFGASGGTLLELGAGGGNMASHYKRRFQATLTDVSAEMLALSRTINPECEHVVGDMRTLRLGREFDAVFVHDAIVYMTSERDLRAALETAFVHLRPGGVAVFAPDYVRETFAPDTESGGYDEGDRGLRFLEWSHDPDPSDCTFFDEFVVLLREGAEVRCEHERHLCGLFAQDEWLRWIEEAGFTGHVREAGHGPVFVGVRPR